MNIRPHDLLWLHADATLLAIKEGWVAQQWSPQQPVVVRRDVVQQSTVPIGVRGEARHQRAAGWVRIQDVARIDAPEDLVARAATHRFHALPTVQALHQLQQQRWSWQWGVTGSTGFALATSLPVLHAASDLDLLIRAPQPLNPDELTVWQQQLLQLPCRADTQIETPYGAFALNEWLRSGQVLLKTARGPRLTHLPWTEENR
ncbi:malonate decarboxylase holo-ACP synthase [Pantoea rwandensis]|uniref:Phosphoribosyl-dephospho-CoA transferase n=1 Tax=Pantoea rwandensis TaxID=1076550 RepID=A0A1X1D5W7_9GAMM|nr:malonate decarboxylase holo-ACP synthase [Pantoea rwandensis]ORM72046.1 phosphoribosyl-dephospho-CoA transferase [Pantoea rwandensis]